MGLFKSAQLAAVLIHPDQRTCEKQPLQPACVFHKVFKIVKEAAPVDGKTEIEESLSKCRLQAVCEPEFVGDLLHWFSASNLELHCEASVRSADLKSSGQSVRSANLKSRVIINGGRPPFSGGENLPEVWLNHIACPKITVEFTSGFHKNEFASIRELGTWPPFDKEAEIVTVTISSSVKVDEGGDRWVEMALYNGNGSRVGDLIYLLVDNKVAKELAGHLDEKCSRVNTCFTLSAEKGQEVELSDKPEKPQLEEIYRQVVLSSPSWLDFSSMDLTMKSAKSILGLQEENRELREEISKARAEIGKLKENSDVKVPLKLDPKRKATTTTTKKKRGPKFSSKKGSRAAKVKKTARR